MRVTQSKIRASKQKGFITLKREFGRDCDVYDLLYAFNLIATKRYGEESFLALKVKDEKGKIRRGALGYLAIEIDAGKEVRVIEGQMDIVHPSLKAEFYISKFGVWLSCEADVRYKEEVEDLFEEVTSFVKRHSIYRGKAFTIRREFLDTSDSAQDCLVFGAVTLEELQIHLWTLIEKSARCRELGLKLQRKILLSGAYGAGKTATALLTAKKATANNWSFIYIPPTTEKLGLKEVEFALFTARQLQPAVVFFEDIDHEQREEDEYSFKKILSEFDGLMSKGVEMVLVMTTNRVDKVSGAMQRPGRIDRIIQLGLLGPQDIQNIITANICDSLIHGDIDWSKVAESCSGYTPAFVKEVAVSATLKAISGDIGRVSGDVLLAAANSLRPQFERCQQDFNGGRYA